MSNLFDSPYTAECKPPVGARPDFVDLRDQVYVPSLGLLKPEVWPDAALFDREQPGRLITGVRHQGGNPTCVGHALAAVIDIQLCLQAPPPPGQRPVRVSAHMLYHMGRYHDAWKPGQVTGQAPGGEAVGIRTLRAAVKAFYHHGVCLADGLEGPFWPDDEAHFREPLWPSSALAQRAEEYTLGAYYRLSSQLNHHHSAVQEAHALLVTAQIHQGWLRPEAGVIKRPEVVEDYGVHAFVVLGYTRQGFLVLNSWGEGWGGLPVPLDKAAVPAPGIALWTYADWAQSVRDAWVLRLGVPGRDAFAANTGERGLPPEVFSRGRSKHSVPYRELRGQFLNLEDGRCVDRGNYATPFGSEAALAEMLAELEARIRQPACSGVVLMLPGIMQPLATAFGQAVLQTRRLEAAGLLGFTCFWCAEFATEVSDILRDILQRCRSRSGADAEHFDQLIEEAARGPGRAFWREIQRNAFAAVFPCDPEGDGPAEQATCKPDPSRGILWAVFARIAKVCAETGKPLHIVTEGAGALVLEALVARADSAEAGPGFPSLASLTLAFPALSVARARKTLLPLVTRMLGADARSVAILVPTPELEARLSVQGYGRSMLHLISESFSDPEEDGLPPVMLGMAAAPGVMGLASQTLPRTAEEHAPEAPFLLTDIPAGGAVEPTQLNAAPMVEAAIRTLLLAAQARFSTRSSFTPVETDVMTRISALELQNRLAAGQLTSDEAQRYLMVDEAASGLFSPVLRFNPETVEMDDDGTRSAMVLNTLNFHSRNMRKANFYRRIGEGYTGPRIAAEGDSWFQYPLLLKDVIDWVAEDYPVFCTSAAGDLLEDMAAKREYLMAIRESGASVLLLSAGGNDLCAGGALATHLEPFTPGLKPADYLRRSYQGLIDNAIGHYERICRDVRQHHPEVTIICHGYDYAIPNRGRWLGKPMAERGITDAGLQTAIATEMVDQFNRALRRMAASLSKVVYVDCRGSVAPGGWHDELHPRDAGYRSAANRILAAIRSALPRAQPDSRSGPANEELADPPQIKTETRAMSLHVGLNEVDPRHYAGWRGELRGCENDARAMRTLAESQGYASTLLLTPQATREAVVEGIERAAADLSAGDHFLFTVSSHGGQVPDLNSDEDIAQPDSTLCLHDCQIIDDELFDLWTKFRSGVRLFLVADCCHSGDIAKFAPPSATFLQATSLAEMQAMSMRASLPRPKAMPIEKAREVFEQNRATYETMAGQFRHVQERLIMSPIQSTMRASLIQLAACQVEEVAFDGEEHGAFTAALLRAWDDGRFDGDHGAFLRRIIEAMGPSRQTPRLLKLPPVDPGFALQRPFLVGGLRKTPTPVTPGQAAVSGTLHTRPISQLLLGEGDEDDAGSGEVVATTPRSRSSAETIARFEEAIRPLGLKHFSAAELLFLGNSHHAPGSGGFGLNSFPPEELWTDVIRPARLLDALRDRLGAPIRILSGYRNDAYNRAIGGERNSMHKKFIAFDIAAEGIPPRLVAETLVEMRGEGLFQGGIGRYDGFTHVDTRGINADWGGNGHKVPKAGLTPTFEQSALEDLASRAFPIRDLPRARSGTEVPGNLETTEAAVNGASLLSLGAELTYEARRAVLYSTQFAQRAADARADPVADRIAWWGVYTQALRATGWITEGSQFRRHRSDKLSVSIDSVALEAIASFVAGSKLAALQKLLAELGRVPDGDRRIALVDLYGSSTGGGLFQLGAAEPEPAGSVSLALGAVQFRSKDLRKRILFASWGGEEAELWVAAERMTLNLEFYQGVAQKIVETKINDAERLIAAFSVAPASLSA